MADRKGLAEANPQPNHIKLGGRTIPLVPPNLNVLADLEEHFDTSFTEIMSVLEPSNKQFIRNLRYVLTAMLRAEDSEITEDWVGRNIDVTNLQEIGEKVMGAFMKSMPVPEVLTQT